MKTHRTREVKLTVTRHDILEKLLPPEEAIKIASRSVESLDMWARGLFKSGYYNLLDDSDDSDRPDEVFDIRISYKDDLA